MERMKEILNRIKSLGVSLALDDFGTGYSSLNHIREIPIDVIKVDQSFVKDLAEDAYSQSFIKMVAELAETIGVSVCVEGIETPEQFRVLQGMKVKYIQGYYFDRPMAVSYTHLYSLDRMEVFAPVYSYHLDNFKNRQVKEKDYSIGEVLQPDGRYAMYYEGGEKLSLIHI